MKTKTKKNILALNSSIVLECIYSVHCTLRFIQCKAHASYGRY